MSHPSSFTLNHFEFLYIYCNTTQKHIYYKYHLEVNVISFVVNGTKMELLSKKRQNLNLNLTDSKLLPKGLVI